MSRPKSKLELKELSLKKFKELTGLLNSYTQEQLHSKFPEKYLNRNIRDVLGHLHHWHLLFLDWYKVGMKGGKPDMPAKDYTWKMTPQLNRAIQELYSTRDLTELHLLLNESHRSIGHIIDKHSDEELFEKKRYGWTGSSSLGQYLVSATSSHYDWAIKLIKKCVG